MGFKYLALIGEAERDDDSETRFFRFRLLAGKVEVRIGEEAGIVGKEVGRVGREVGRVGEE